MLELMESILTRIKFLRGCKGDREKGSMAIEAGISLSALVFFSMMLLIFIRSQQIVEAMDQCLFESSKYIQSKNIPLGDVSLVKAVYVEHEVKKKFEELSKKKNINPKLCSIDITMMGEDRCIIKGKVSFSFGKKPFFERIYSYDTLLSGIAMDDEEHSFTVTCHGQRFHRPDCHIVSGKEGAVNMDIEDAINQGKTACNICIGKKLFGREIEE